jgi:hypothetical protein
MQFHFLHSDYLGFYAIINTFLHIIANNSHAIIPSKGSRSRRCIRHYYTRPNRSYSVQDLSLFLSPSLFHSLSKTFSHEK